MGSSSPDPTPKPASQDATLFVPAGPAGPIADHTVPMSPPAGPVTLITRPMAAPVSDSEAATVGFQGSATLATRPMAAPSGSEPATMVTSAGNRTIGSGILSRDGSLILRTRINPTLPPDQQEIDHSLQQSRQSLFLNLLHAHGPISLPPAVRLRLEVQETIGRYTVNRPLAKGGMGAVMEITDGDFQRQAAMKVVLGQYSRDPSALERFLDEAQVTAQLEHPNIVPIHDVGAMADGTLYYTMKLIRGESLANMVKKRRAGDPEVLAKWTEHAVLLAFLKVLDGVGYAHARGVIHRDLKPDNIMVEQHGEVLVVDWGIAKVLGTSDRPDQEVHSLRDDQSLSATLTGATIGTPYYMPPEQALGDKALIGPVSDVYALGATLYELLSNEKPLKPMPMSELIVAITEGRIIPLEQVAPQLHPDLMAIVRKAMAVIPDRRYQSCEEFAADLRQYLGGLAVAARQRGLLERLGAWIHRHRVQVMVGMVMALLLAGGVTGTLVVLHRISQQQGHDHLLEAQGKLTEAGQLTDLDKAIALLDKAKQACALAQDRLGLTSPVIDTQSKISVELETRKRLREEAIRAASNRQEAHAMVDRAMKAMASDPEGALSILKAAYTLCPDLEVLAALTKVQELVKDELKRQRVAEAQRQLLAAQKALTDAKARFGAVPTPNLGWVQGQKGDLSPLNTGVAETRKLLDTADEAAKAAVRQDVPLPQLGEIQAELARLRQDCDQCLAQADAAQKAAGQIAEGVRHLAKARDQATRIPTVNAAWILAQAGDTRSVEEPAAAVTALLDQALASFLAARKQGVLIAGDLGETEAVELRTRLNANLQMATSLSEGWRRSQELRKEAKPLLTQAEAARARSEPGAEKDVLAQARTALDAARAAFTGEQKDLNRDIETAASRLAELERIIESEARRQQALRQAGEALTRAEAAHAGLAQAEQRLVQAQAAIVRLTDQLKDRPAEVKTELWQAHATRREASQARLEQRGILETNATAVLDLLAASPTHPTAVKARTLLVALLRARIEELRRREDAASTDQTELLSLEQALKRFDPQYSADRNAAGQVAISGPAGTRITLRPVTAGPDTRLVPSGEARGLTLPVTDLALPPGRWQLSEGPIELVWAQPPGSRIRWAWPEAAKLPRIDQAVGKGRISIPLRFVPGRDGGRGFMLGEGEITHFQYLPFIHDPEVLARIQADFSLVNLRPSPVPNPSGRSEIWWIAQPKQAVAEGTSKVQYYQIGKDLEARPVTGLSRRDAEAYCAWLSRITGLKVRLPTAEEWTWTSSGGDAARIYPWGEIFDPAFVRTAFRRDSPLPDPLDGPGLDRGPFGHRHLGGNVREWLADRRDPRIHVHEGLIAGGGFEDALDYQFTSRFTEAVPPTMNSPIVGFRILVELP